MIELWGMHAGYMRKIEAKSIADLKGEGYFKQWYYLEFHSPPRLVEHTLLGGLLQTDKLDLIETLTKVRDD